MIDQATADKIINTADIVDVVSEFVTLRRSGANYKGLCPFHNEKTPSFMVSPAKGVCKCFSCGKGGNVVHFLMEHEQFSYPEALRWLAKKYNIEIEEKELTAEQKQAQSERESMFIVNEWARDYFHSNLYNSVDGMAIGMAYFRSRGFRDDIIKKFQLGFSLNSFDALTKEAIAHGFDKKFLLSTSICKQKEDGSLYDTFRGRVMFPWISVSGKVVAFGGRVLDAATKGVNQKYVNSSESSIYSKRRELYGLYQAKKAIAKENRVFMVEGYTDVISMHQCGIENVVANSGTALSMEQVRLLHRFTSNITLLYDGDDAGIHATQRGTDMLLTEGMNVKILLLPKDEDPDSFARKHNASEFKEYIENNQTDFIVFITNHLLQSAGNDPIKRANVINDIVKSISVIPEGVTRSIYISECAQLLKISEMVLVDAVNKARIQNKQQTEKQAAAEKARKQREENGGTAVSGEQIPVPPEVLEAQAVEAQEQGAPQLIMPQNAEIADFINSKTNNSTEIKERMLATCIVRYGEKNVYVDEDEEGNEKPISVIEYISEEFKRDNLSFTNPKYKQILDEGIQHLNDEGFSAKKFFGFHPNQEISILAADLQSDRYQLSKYHSKGQKILNDEEILFDIVPHIINDLKNDFITRKMDDIKTQMKIATINNDSDRVLDLMKQFQNLSKIQNLLAKELGDRTVKYCL